MGKNAIPIVWKKRGNDNEVSNEKGSNGLEQLRLL